MTLQNLQLNNTFDRKLHCQVDSRPTFAMLSLGQKSADAGEGKAAGKSQTSSDDTKGLTPAKGNNCSWKELAAHIRKQNDEDKGDMNWKRSSGESCKSLLYHSNY